MKNFNKKGFSLVEGLIAVLLLMTVVVGIYGVLLSAYRSVQKSTITTGGTELNITRIKKALEFAYSGYMDRAFEMVPCLGITTEGEDLTVPPPSNPWGNTTVDFVPILFRPGTSYDVGCLLPQACGEGSYFIYNIPPVNQQQNKEDLNANAVKITYPSFLTSGIQPEASKKHNTDIAVPEPQPIEFIIDCVQN